MAPRGVAVTAPAQGGLRFAGVGRAFAPAVPGAAPVVALDGVSFEVGAGSRTAIVGPSGAGKSYVAEEISNIDPPYTTALLAPTQRLIRAITAVAGEPAVGFTVLPASDFLFRPDGASG